MTVALGHDLWTRRFGADVGVVGREITIDGGPRTVVGVMPRGFAWPLESQVYVSTAFHCEGAGDAARRTLPAGDRTTARRRDADTGRRGAADDRRPARRRVPAHQRGLLGDRPSARAHVVRHARPTLLLLLGAVGWRWSPPAPTSPASALARAMARGRDLAVRASLGADPRRLMRELAVESLLLAAAGAAVGVAVAAVLVDSLPRWAGEMPRLAEARLDLGGALVVAALAGLCGLASGLLPALHALRRDPIEALRAGSRGVAGNRLADRAAAGWWWRPRRWRSSCSPARRSSCAAGTASPRPTPACRPPAD
jgi:putative ABC transport system permease protein